MKNIKDYMIHESSGSTVDNIIISGSGSMSSDGENIALLLKKTFKNANLYVYNTSKDEVIPLEDINDFKATGPHNNKLSGVAKFYEEHLGEMTIFIQN